MGSKSLLVLITVLLGIATMIFVIIALWSGTIYRPHHVGVICVATIVISYSISFILKKEHDKNISDESN